MSTAEARIRKAVNDAADQFDNPRITTEQGVTRPKLEHKGALVTLIADCIVAAMLNTRQAEALPNPDATIERLRVLLGDDGFAATYQSIAQYRRALLDVINRAE